MKYNINDIVIVIADDIYKLNEVGKIAEIDIQDPELPYYVKFEDGTFEWYEPYQIRKYVRVKKPNYLKK